jgi:hypothetical protein
LTKNRLVALGQTVVDYAGMKPRCQELFANFSQSQHPQAFQTLPKTSWEGGEWNNNGSSRERSYPAFKSTISPSPLGVVYIVRCGWPAFAGEKRALIRHRR